MEQTKNFRGYVIAAACCIIMFIHQGIFATMGVFMPSIAAENGWAIGSVGVVYTWAGIAGALGAMLIAPIVIEKLTPKWSIFMSSFGICLHMIWYSRASSLMSFYISGAFGGILISFGTLAAVNVIIGNWFIKNRKTVVGLVVGAASFGGAFFIALCGKLLSAMSYRTVYVICGIIVLVVGGVVNLLLIRNKPEDVGQVALGANEMNELNPAAAGPSEEIGLTLKEALRTPAFYLAFIACMFSVVGWIGFKSYFASLLQSAEFGMETATASYYTSFLNIFAAIAAIIGGRIAEKLGNRFYVIYMTVALSAGILIIVLTGGAIVDMPALLIFAMVLAALSAPNSSATAPILTGDLFGNKGYAQISIFLIAALQLGSAVFPLVVSAVLAKGMTLITCFWIFLGATMIGLVFFLLALAMSPLKKRKE